MDEPFDPWWRDGICAEIGTDLFFVGKGQSNAAAKQACRICPVRLKCLTDALTSDLGYGVFGGFTPPERRRLQHGNQTPAMAAYAAIDHDRSTSWRS